ncbi:hypothetical protein CEXT_704391 [Caerostris extrusa]|uniref:Uncharacterized protein n=1 Tax=Caerostris extrusa TaxID=172846 RepID=A0AAV4T4I3_CAEEX|nr:hypothetical protein CEXT_704391 [Caerostris extrusa]
MKDDQHYGRPVTLRTDENFGKSSMEWLEILKLLHKLRLYNPSNNGGKNPFPHEWTRRVSSLDDCLLRIFHQHDHCRNWQEFQHSIRRDHGGVPGQPSWHLYPLACCW